MRKASTLAGLILMALASTARAQEGVPAVVAPAPPLLVDGAPAPGSAPQQKRIEVGLSFLPMGLGRLTVPVGVMETNGAAAFAYGVALYGGYRIVEGLSVGLAPQAIFNVQDKVNPSQLASPGAARQYDLMVRVAYEQPLVETIAVYAEVLPGYSIIAQPGSSSANGLVLGFGGGVIMGLTDLVFTNIGVGYQVGFQSLTQGGMELQYRSRYLRVALGGGVRF